MSNIIANINTLPLPLPDGVTAGALRVDLFTEANPGAPAVATGDSVNGTIKFSNVAPGDYHAVVTRLDSNGNAIGSSVTSNTLNVPTPATYDAPQSITLVLG